MRVCKSVDDMLAAYHEIGEKRRGLPYEINGVVYKVNELALQHRLGFVSRTPRWGLAHKYAPEQATTILEAIEIQVGRTGELTPVARLKPVPVGGVIGRTPRCTTKITSNASATTAKNCAKVGATCVLATRSFCSAPATSSPRSLTS